MIAVKLRVIRKLQFLLICAVLRTTAVADRALPCVLDLRNGDFVRGTLDSIDNETIVWNSEHFAIPLRFRRSNVEGMTFAPANQTDPTREFLIELSNHDTFYADILGMEDHGIRLETAAFGVATFSQGSIQQVIRSSPQVRTNLVPSQLEDWNPTRRDQWRTEGNRYVTEHPMASLYADVGLPVRALIELDFSWEKSPNSTELPRFSIYLGTDETESSREKAFSIEVWESYAVVQRETKNDADLASLQSMHAAGSMRVIAYVDQDKGQLILYDSKGKLLADLRVPSNGWRANGITFLNRVGKFCLNDVQVRGWTGKPVGFEKSTISVQTKTDTFACDSIKLLADEVVSISLVGGESRKFALSDVMRIDFPSLRSPAPRGVTVDLRDGGRLSGKLVIANRDRLQIQRLGSKQLLQLPIESLCGFTLQHESSSRAHEKAAPRGFHSGRLELMDTRLGGWLVEGSSSVDDASCLIWRSGLSMNASPLKRDAFGRIVYREPIRIPHHVDATQDAARTEVQVDLAQGIARRPNATPQKIAPTKSTKAIHLRTGDVIPCTVKGIDEQGVHIESSMTESTLVRHDQVKAAQLIKNAPIPLLSQAKRDRLLTLPRMLRNSPPSHLLFSRNGDVLRGTVVSLNAKQLEMEIRLNPRPIPRHRVATIVWLHEDEVDDHRMIADAVTRKDTLNEPSHKGELNVQVVHNQGTRFTFDAKSFKNQTIHGTSEVLNKVHAKVGEIDQLLLGEFIKRNAKTLRFGGWHLNSAVDPKFVTADTASPSTEKITPGTESRLVGSMAPDVRLKMLDEKTDFRLADHRGHCVVLDFWATWCGPCLHVMPVVEEVVSEFAAQDVRLFAINLAERPAEIKSTLERRGLDFSVVLDRDGTAAAKYEANAIPQTVVIGPDGTVARIFVGNSKRLAEQLRAALAQLTRGERPTD